MSKIKRTFRSEAELLAFNDAAKAALGLPWVGVNAETGEPEPDKQQTTDWVRLGPDVEGQNPLEVAILRLDDEASMTQVVRADLLTKAELAAIADQFPAWVAWTSYAVDEVVSHAGLLYACVQAHTSQDNWQPPNVPALWRETAANWVIPVWKQPLGAHDAFPIGYRVVHNGEVWESIAAANVWAPGVYGWVLVDSSSTASDLPLPSLQATADATVLEQSSATASLALGSLTFTASSWLPQPATVTAAAAVSLPFVQVYVTPAPNPAPVYEGRVLRVPLPALTSSATATVG